MKHLKLLFLCALLAIFYPNYSKGQEVITQGEKVLSLEDCLSLAKKNNLKLVQAENSVEQARAGVMSAYSSYYPSFDLSSEYRYGKGYIGEEGNYSTSIGLKYTPYKGGNILTGTKIAKMKETTAEENYRLAEGEVFLSVKEAFFRILQRMEGLTRAEKTCARRKDDLILIKLKYQAGRESDPAVKEAEANLLQAEYDKMAAEEELSLARAGLNLLIGRPRREIISINYEDKDTEFPPRERLIEEAIMTRAEICIERTNKKMQETQLSQDKTNYFPTLSLSSSYGWQGSKFLELKPESDWSAGISLSFPIFDGFLRKANLREATLAVAKEKVKIQELEQRIEEEVEQAYSNLVLAKKNIEVSEKTLQATQEMYNLTKLQYEQGQTSYFFLQQKENSLTQAEYNYVNALFNLRVTTARIEKVWGK